MAIPFLAQTIFKDNVKLVFGDGLDLQIYHDGSNSRIGDAGTGNLIISGTNLHLTDAATGEYFFRGTSNGAVQLYYDGTEKFITTSTGIDVTGTVNLDNLTINSAQGTDGQVLTSTGTGIAWEDIASETAERIEVTVKNVSGGSLSKGTVVHASPSATPPSGNVIEVIAADYDDSTKMPAIGILNETIADTAEGSAVMMGAVSGIDTSSFSIGDELYVGNLGTLTNTKPATSGQLIQKIAVVIKSHASNGLIKIFGAGRSNDVPLPLYIDNTNQRVGIGTDSPTRQLTIFSSAGSRLALTSGSTANCNILFGDTSDDNKGSIRFDNSSSSFEHRASIFDFKAQGSSALYINSSRNVGIGTTSPGGKLHVATPDPASNFVAIDFRNPSYGIYAKTNSISGRGNTLEFTATDYNSGGTILTTDLLTLRPEGNVGIGTTTPSQKLHVAGNVTADRYYGNGSTVYYVDPNDSTTSAILNGKVGIGTTSPSTKLHLSDTSDSIIRIQRVGVQELQLNSDGTVTAASTDLKLVSTGNISFTANSSERMRIDSSGNVTIRSGNKLILNRPDNAIDSEISTDSSGTLILNSRNGEGFDFQNGGTSFFTADSSGRLGLGTSSPSFPLHVRKDSGTYEIITIQNNTSAALFRAIGNGGGTVDFGAEVGTADTAIIRTGGTERMRIGPAGQIGIGGANYGTSGQVLTSNGSGSAPSWQNAGAGSSNWTLSGNDIYNNNSGNVGIGTTSPGAKLHTRDSSTSPGIIIESDGGNEQFVIKRYSNTNEQLILGFHSSDYGTIQAVEQGVSYRNLALNASGGNVGIGTTSPAEKLHVNGKVRIGDYMKIESSANYMGVIGFNRDTGNGNIYNSNYGAYQLQNQQGKLLLQVYNSGGSSVTQHAFDNSGNLGIGTTSPINGGGNAKWITIDGASGNNYSGGVVYSIGGTSKGYHYVQDNNIIHQGQPGVGHRFLANAGDAMTITSGRNVGIGTTTPSQKLHVAGNVTADRYYGNGSTVYYVDPNDSTTAAVLAGGLEIGYGSAGEYRIEVGEGRTGNGYAYIDFVGDTTYSDYGLRLIRNNSGANTSSQLVHRGTGNLEFKTWDAGAMLFSTTNSERMRITSGGNVGIGTSSPASKLHIQNSAGGSGGYLKITDVTYGGDVRFGMADGVNNDVILGSWTNNSILVYTNTAERARITNTGNVGINTTGPAEKLQVVGNIGAGDGTYNGGVYANSSSTAVDTNWGFDFLKTTGQNDYSTRLKYYPVTGESRKAGIWNSRNNTWVLYGDSNNTPNVIIPSGSLRAPIFYDSNDTAYYLDPNTTATSLNTAGSARIRNIDISPSSAGDTIQNKTSGGNLWLQYSHNGPVGLGYGGGLTTAYNGLHVYAKGSGWDDGLNLYSSDDTNKWNLLVDDGAADAFRIAYNNSDRLYFYTSGEAVFSGSVTAHALTSHNTRISSAQEFPVGHYTGGKEIWSIDTTWDNTQLQEYFGSSNVSWNADSTAPGGYAIYINGNVNVGGDYNSGFPYIPIETDAIYYMECYIRNAGTGQTHYMGSIDYNESFGTPSTGSGNPGSYGYFVMANTNPGTSWTKVTGIIRSNSASSTGYFEIGAKYWTPQALFNYGAGSGTRACYISGWKVIKISAAEYYADGSAGSPSIAFAEDQNTGIYRTSADGLGISTGGTNRLNITSSGSTFSGDLQVAGLKTEGPDGGLVLRTWTGNTSYGMLGTANMSGSEYSLLTDGTNTYISGGASGSVYLRAGNNYSNNQLELNSSKARFYGDVQSDDQFINNGNGFKSLNFRGMVGDYDTNSTATKIIWTIGDSWNTTTSMYGLAYEYNATYGHHLALKENGTTYQRLSFYNGSSFSGTVTSNTDFRAPVFYDSNDTNYKVDPANVCVLNRVVTGTSSTSNSGTALHVTAASSSTSTPIAYFYPTFGNYGGIGVQFQGLAYGNATYFNSVSPYDGTLCSFRKSGTQVGSISVGTSSTSFNTTSDYRLKENITELTDGIERVKQLQPKRFNFIGDEDTVDGFIAHEAVEVVPESVTGEKDEVLPNGEPVYQGIDQAKLVPLLTAALQEAIAKIEDLETRIQILENQ